MIIDKEKCSGCGYCFLACPHDAIVTSTTATIIEERCTDCGICAYVCPCEAIGTLHHPLSDGKATKGMDTNYDAIVIGAGIGGLLTAAGLAKAGRSVLLLERLSFIGGRAAYFRYKDYTVTAGAWLLGRPLTYIGELCAQLGAEYEFVDRPPAARSMVRFTKRGIKDTPFSWSPRLMPQFVEALPEEEQARIKEMSAQMRSGDLPTDLSIAEWTMNFTKNEDFHEVLDAFCDCAWALSAYQTPAKAWVEALSYRLQSFRDQRYPLRGCQGVIDALEQVIKANGGEVRTRARVSAILVEGGKAVGVRVGARRIRASVVIHNGGPNSLVRLVGREKFPSYYVRKVESLYPLPCMGIMLALKKDPFPGVSTLLTPDNRRIRSVYFPQAFQAEVGPQGRYMCWGFGHMVTHDAEEELRLAIEDMKHTFPDVDFKKDVEFLLPMFFRKAWPGCESAPTFGQVDGQRLDIITPVENLYLVGADTGKAGLAGDTAGESAKRLLERLLN